jgi:hydroxymethylbilane synthase
MADKTPDETFSRPLRLASRKSALAMKQAELTRTLLAPAEIEIIGLSSLGDQVLDRPLADIGGKGLFVKTLEAALLEGRADLAVHSMKDMETKLAEGTCLAAVLPREDRRDALLGAESLHDLPDGARIGTASVRRAAFLRHHRPDLRISLLRGNLQTRLAKLEAGEHDAIILAVAGLKRLGIESGWTALDEAQMRPAAGQGIIAIQARTDNPALLARLAHLTCADTADCATAERAVLAALDGSCRTPIAANADIAGDQIQLYAALLSADGQELFEGRQAGPRADAARLGQQLGEDLLAACGGPDFLRG